MLASRPTFSTAFTGRRVADPYIYFVYVSATLSTVNGLPDGQPVIFILLLCMWWKVLHK